MVEDGEDEEEEEDDREEDEALTSKKKKKKKKRKKKPTHADEAEPLTTPEAQSTYLWARYVDLLHVSPLDAEVNLFPPPCFALPSSKKKKSQAPKDKPKPTPDKADAQVTHFLQQTFPQLQAIASDKSQRQQNAPFVLILSSSAVRANDLAKDLRVKLRNLKTAKLFAKHLKVQAQVDLLQQEFNALAVGTPNRLAKLLEMGALSLARCRLVVLDTTFKDSKAFNLLTLPGVAKDSALLLQEHVLPEMAKRKKAGVKKEEEQLRVALF